MIKQEIMLHKLNGIISVDLCNSNGWFVLGKGYVHVEHKREFDPFGVLTSEGGNIYLHVLHPPANVKLETFPDVFYIKIGSLEFEMNIKSRSTSFINGLTSTYYFIDTMSHTNKHE